MLTSFSDLLIIGGAALLVFGPKRLPELGKALGASVRDFKKAMAGEDEKKSFVPPSSTSRDEVKIPEILDSPR